MSIKYANADILSVPTITNLFSLKNIQDNQLVQTQGYSSEGIGSNLYRYDAGSSATIDGGFILPGLSGTLSFSGITFNGSVGTGRFIAVDQTIANVMVFGAIGDGVASDEYAIQRAMNSSKLVRLGDSHLLSADITIPTGCKVEGQNSVLTGSATSRLIQITGSKSVSADCFLAQSANRSDMSILVNSDVPLSVGDAIVIEASSEEDNNSTKGSQRELNYVVSKSSNTVTLRYGLSHDYEYNGAFSAQPAIYLCTPSVGSSINGVSIVDCTLLIGEVENTSVDITLNNGVFSSLNKTVRSSLFQVRSVSSIGAGDNAHVFLHGATDCSLKVVTHGGSKDGIRLCGCCNTQVICNINEAPERGVWLYKCNSVAVEGSITGSQVLTTNIEGFLFDFSNDCSFTGHIKEPGKTSSFNLVEFRRTSKDCVVYNSHLESYTLAPIIVKCATNGCCVRNSKIDYNQESTGWICDWQNDGGTPGDFRFCDNNIVSNQSTISLALFRSTSTTSITSNTATIRIEGNTYQRGASYIVLLDGDVGSQPLHRLIIDSNHSTSDTNSGAHILVNLPVTQVMFTNNTISDGTNRSILFNGTGAISSLYVHGCNALAINIGSNVTNAYLGANGITTYTLNSLSQLKSGTVTMSSVVDIASITAGAFGTSAIGWTGLSTSDTLVWTAPSNLDSSLIPSAYISGTGTITVKLFNPTGSPIDPAAGTWKFAVIKQ